LGSRSNKVIKYIQFFILLIMPMALAEPTGAQTWWNEKWQYRKKITFDTTPTGANIKENLSDVPLLLRLHTGNFNFSNAKEDGEDIRFVNGDDKTPLKHHIERFDPIDEIALIWVRVPRLSGGSNQDFMWMYYGNDAATGGQDAGGTYDVDQVVVYHLEEMEGPPKDRTAYRNHASQIAGAQGLPSVIGNGVAFSGPGDRIVIPASPSLDLSKGLTFSTWIRITQPLADAYIFSRGEEERALAILISGTKVCGRITLSKEELVITEECADLPLNTWHHLAVTAMPKGRLSIYLDGIEMYWMNLPVDLPALDTDIYIGASKSGDHSLFGDLDEIRISKAARPGAWIRAAYMAEGPDSTLLSYGEEELGKVRGGLPLIYLKTVLQNITLDGWAIIGILIFMAMASWIVFLSKTLFLWIMQKDNRAFMASFTGLTDLVALDGESNAFQSSPLYRVYLSGCQELRKWIGNPVASEEKAVIPPKGMNALRAALERGYIQETQRLNAWLIIMTIALTGGPFLGLLGTVWGVMNTFAAMAEAGEANIMAIAPGVASALSTTVCGLIVAIPALFGYNYLVSKIRGITADMTIFVDQFALKADEAHGVTS
jgi:biopolymer transport protein ExbB